MSYHLVFTGNPGTGKTTVARIVGRIFKELGVLRKGHLVETDRSGLIAEFVGRTAQLVIEMVDKAMDGLLFIDEAYALVSKDAGVDFGPEAIATLLRLMENHRDRLVVIVAGYPDEMEIFINSNPGLKSRFTNVIHFPDYNPDELLAIFLKLCEDDYYRLAPEGSDRPSRSSFHTTNTAPSDTFDSASSRPGRFRAAPDTPRSSNIRTQPASLSA